MSHRSLCRLISLAAGALLGVTVFVIIPECREGLTTVQVAAALISGYGVFFLVSRYVFHVCPACAASHFDEAATRHFSEIAVAMIVALGLHSTLTCWLALGRRNPWGGMTPPCCWPSACTRSLKACARALLLAWHEVLQGRRRAAVESTTPWRHPGSLDPAQGFPALIDLALAHGGGFIFLALHAVL